MWLTMLTIMMVIIICLRKELSIEFTAASIIIVKLVGWVMGNLGAKVFLLFIDSFGIVHALSTLLTTEIIGWGTVFLVNNVIATRVKVKEEREKANMAQYRYIKLKHQVNPHFLFNSLNILDCLICEEETERASAYTHKLAGIYRYMIKSEDDPVVSVRDELVFVGLYVDLLKERFPAGFDVNIDVPTELMDRMVLTCSIQMLIENATKHNAISEDNPLIINIAANNQQIIVTNNLVPKMTPATSTGLGLKYIKQMYLDLTNKPINIEQTEAMYKVTLPLI